MSLKLFRVFFVAYFVAYLVFSVVAILADESTSKICGVSAVGCLAFYFLGYRVSEIIRRKSFKKRFSHSRHVKVPSEENVIRKTITVLCIMLFFSVMIFIGLSAVFYYSPISRVCGFLAVVAAAGSSLGMIVITIIRKRQS